MAVECRSAKGAKRSNSAPAKSGKVSTGEKREKIDKGLLQLVDDPNAKHRAFAGTTSEAFNTATLNQALSSVWYGASPDDEKYTMLAGSAAGAMLNIAPEDAIEGELWRKLGDDGLRRAAYRGGC